MKLYALLTSREKSAMDAAHRMRAVLAGDVEETAKTASIIAMNDELSASQLILDAWHYLPSPERRAWKEYCKRTRK